MGRILMIAAVIVAALFLLGPLVGFVFTLLKWALILSAAALVVVLATKWFART
ncbi:hypothetical protein [Nonomuraea sp. NPDC048916]|uniref:hypothetical protein n=1 Tax=Nonomuraea sp. NPDC048916 TaxID=3154232 RepID=UPI0033FABCE4